MKKLLTVFASLGALALVGCGPVQSPECAQYIECQEAIDADQGTSVADGLQDAYGETGTCWSTTAEAAQICTESCVDALESLSSSYPDIAACQEAPAEG